MTTLRMLRQSRLRWIMLAVLLASLTGLVTGQFAIANATASRPKPTIVLVHGAWADSGSWDQVIERLQRDGYTVDAPPNPLRGLPDDAAYIAAFLHSISGPIVLVGHSYGGAVITNAATANSNVKALVFVDAFIPDQDETLGQLAGAVPGSCVAGDPTQIFNLVPFPGAPPGVVDAYLKQPLFPSCMANDLPARQAAVLAATQRPLSTIAIGQPSGPPAWKTIPSWAVVGLADHAIPPAEQLVMAGRAHARITKVNASHLSMISDSGTVTDVIVDAARSTD